MIINLAPGVDLTLTPETAQHVREQIDRLLAGGDTGMPPPAPPAPVVLSEDHPMWDQASGGSTHHGTPWEAGDTLAAQTFLLQATERAKVFLDLLIDHPGRQFTVDEICENSNGAYTGARSLAGALAGLAKAQRASGRRYPFTWWEGTPSRYAMRPAVAQLLCQAR